MIIFIMMIRSIVVIIIDNLIIIHIISKLQLCICA